MYCMYIYIFIFICREHVFLSIYTYMHAARKDDHLPVKLLCPEADRVAGHMLGD